VHICEPDNPLGYAHVQLPYGTLYEFDVPYDLEYYNVDNGQEGEMSMIDRNAYLSFLTEGTYELTVFLDGYCKYEAEFVVFAKTQIELEAEVKGVNCEGVGEILFGASSLGLGLDVMWSDGYSSLNREVYSPGIYCVEVRPSGDEYCAVSECFEVGYDEDYLEVEIVEFTNLAYCSERIHCNAAIEVRAIGNSTYRYEWYHGVDGRRINNLCPGEYSVLISGSDGCFRTLDFTVCCCAADASTEGKVPICSNISDGDALSISGRADSPNRRIGASPIGGSGSYVCTWTGPEGNIISSNCGSIENIEKLGTYCLSVDDGCSTVKRCFEIVDCESYSFELNFIITNTCRDLNFGSIEIIPDRKHRAVRYDWEHDDQSRVASELAEGEFCVRITDHTGCAVRRCYTVGLNSLSELDVTSPCGTQLSCNDVPVDFIPYDGELECEYNDPFDCRVYNCICPLTGGVSLSGSSPYLEEDVFNRQNCVLEAICPSGQVVITDYGRRIDTLVLIELPPRPGCIKCFKCYRLDVCKIGSTIWHTYSMTESGDCKREELSSDDEYNFDFGKLPWPTAMDLLSSAIPLSEEFVSLNQLYDIANFEDLWRVSSTQHSEDPDSKGSDGVTKLQYIASPNPVSERLVISTNDQSVDMVRVLDAYGQVLSEIDGLSSRNVIDCASYSSGIYFVCFLSNGHIIKTRKIFKT